jgi:hypothetical protein
MSIRSNLTSPSLFFKHFTCTTTCFGPTTWKNLCITLLPNCVRRNAIWWDLKEDLLSCIIQFWSSLQHMFRRPNIIWPSFLQMLRANSLSLYSSNLTYSCTPLEKNLNSCTTNATLTATFNGTLILPFQIFSTCSI